jgi:hypothetical protein
MEQNWSKIKTAYGTAENVPRMLAQLESATGKRFDELFSELVNEICHQGTVYEAMVYVVPRFIELLRDDPPPHYAAIAEWLAYLSAKAFEYVKRPPNLSPRTATNPFTGGAVEFHVDDDRKWVRRSREAIETGLDVYLPLLRHKNLSMRCSAAQILAAFPEEAAQLVPMLITMMGFEQHPAARAAIMLSFAEFEHRSSEVAELLIARLATAADRTERHAAAVSLVILHGREASNEALALVRNLSRDPKWYTVLRMPHCVTEPLVKRAFAVVAD